MKKRIIWVAAVFLVLCAVYWHWCADADILFDSNSWRMSKPHKYEPRYRMSKAILTILKSGEAKTKQFVLDTLGPPEQGAEGDYWLYNPGSEHNSLFVVDNDWLRLRFDQSGKLDDARVAPD